MSHARHSPVKSKLQYYNINPVKQTNKMYSKFKKSKLRSVAGTDSYKCPSAWSLDLKELTVKGQKKICLTEYWKTVG